MHKHIALLHLFSDTLSKHIVLAKEKLQKIRVHVSRYPLLPRKISYYTGYNV